MSGFNPGVPLGAVTAIKIVGSDSVVLDLVAGLVGAAAGGMAWDVLGDSWAERQRRRADNARSELGPI